MQVPRGEALHLREFSTQIRREPADDVAPPPLVTLALQDGRADSPVQTDEFRVHATLCRESGSANLLLQLGKRSGIPGYGWRRIRHHCSVCPTNHLQRNERSVLRDQLCQGGCDPRAKGDLHHGAESHHTPRRRPHRRHHRRRQGPYHHVRFRRQPLRNRPHRRQRRRTPRSVLRLHRRRPQGQRPRRPHQLRQRAEARRTRTSSRRSANGRTRTATRSPPAAASARPSATHTTPHTDATPPRKEPAALKAAGSSHWRRYGEVRSVRIG